MIATSSPTATQRTSTLRTSTLRRFLAPPPVPADGPWTSRPQRNAGPRCDLCGEVISADHRHVADLVGRSIQCACPACRLLFTSEGAGGGRYRTVPTRYRYVPSFPAGARLWATAGIPVGLAFLVTASQTGVTTAFYPSPAGATECELPVSPPGGRPDSDPASDPDLDPVRSVPAFADLTPDVEALLVRRVPDTATADGGFEAFLLPIDACYRLVGELRLHWRGFDGGGEARDRLSSFLDDVRTRARRAGEAGSG